jgi:hypothetical protein
MFEYISLSTRACTEADIVVAIFEGVALQNPIAVAIVVVVACLRASSSEREVGHTPVYAPVNAPVKTPCHRRGNK